MIYLGNTPVGVASKEFGDFTKHEQTTATGVGNSNNFMEISTSFTPKLAIISGGTDASGHIMGAVVSFVVNCGGAVFRNAANQSLSYSGYNVKTTDTSPAAAATQCYFYNGKILISRSNSNGYFSENDTFTVDIYG